MTFRVVTGRVAAETNVGPGRATVDFHRGAVLPDDVPAEQIASFLARGLLESVDGSPEPEPGEVDLSELDKDALLALADERGIAVDKRLGEDKLRAAIQEAE